MLHIQLDNFSMPRPHTTFDVHGILLRYSYAMRWIQACAGHPREERGTPSRNQKWNGLRLCSLLFV